MIRRRVAICFNYLLRLFMMIFIFILLIVIVNVLTFCLVSRCCSVHPDLAMAGLSVVNLKCKLDKQMLILG